MEFFFSYNQSKIFYRKYGNDSSVIVLLHGFAEDGNVWKEQIDFLKDHFTLIVPDLPGSGKSSIVNGQLSIENYAEMMYDLLSNENIKSCVMLGHSMGGYITLSFAEKYPDMLKGIGLVNSTAFADSSEKKESRKKGIELMEKYGPYSFIKTTTPNLFSSSYKKNNADKIEVLIEKGKQFSKETLQQYYTAMMNRPDKTNVLREAKFPVLFIAGKEDVAVSLNDILQQMYLPLVSYICILKNAGHMGMWEAAEEVNKAILNFVRDTCVS
jgi:pimeloyl-ACP methyl ester carboxylesterase